MPPIEMNMSNKSETMEGYYHQNGREYPYTLEAVIRDESGRNDTFDVIGKDGQPDDADSAEEAVVDEYFRKEVRPVSDYTKRLTPFTVPSPVFGKTTAISWLKR